MVNEIELTQVYGSPINIVGPFVYKPSVYIHEFTKEERDQLEHYIIDKTHDLDLDPIKFDWRNSDTKTLGPMMVAYCFNTKARKAYNHSKSRFTVINAIKTSCTAVDTGLNQHYQEWVLYGEVGHYEERIREVNYFVTQTCEEIRQARENGISSLHDTQTNSKYKTSKLQDAKSQIDINLQKIKEEEIRRFKSPLWRRAYLAIT